jgi:hypothetical protein
MDPSYAVVFREQGGPPAAGALALRGDRLVLSGQGRELELPLEEVEDVRSGTRGERVNGRPTLVLERIEGNALHVAPLGAGLVHEIADLVTGLTRKSGDALAVALPLIPGCAGRARELLAEGPPLDLEALGLTGHEVYLYGDEAVFVFRGPNAASLVGRAARRPALWRAGIAWQACMAGRPRVVEIGELALDRAEPAYSWAASRMSV